MKNSGVTSIELIAVLALASILIGIVAPRIINIHNRSKATAEINWIIGAINYSRHSAIIRRTTVTLCPYANNSRECNGKWHEGLIAIYRLQSKCQDLTARTSWSRKSKIRLRMEQLIGGHFATDNTYSLRHMGIPIFRMATSLIALKMVTRTMLGRS